jgi:hypothetical protein
MLLGTIRAFWNTTGHRDSHWGAEVVDASDMPRVLEESGNTRGHLTLGNGTEEEMDRVWITPKSISRRG